LFIASSLLMIWALEAMNAGGLEGTVLGTLITPYCTGLGNLLVTFVVARDRGPGSEVMTNALVNNVTNMTLLIGLPAIFWTMNVLPQNTAAKGKKKKRGNNNRVHEINRLSLLLTLTAVLFFTGAVWALARKGRLDFGDGLVLVGLFLFWQLFHVYDVLKSNLQKNKSLDWMLWLYVALLGVGAYAQYLASIGWINGYNIAMADFSARKILGCSAAGFARCRMGCWPSITAGAATRRSSTPRKWATDTFAFRYASGFLRFTIRLRCRGNFKPACTCYSGPRWCTCFAWWCSGNCRAWWESGWSAPMEFFSTKDCCDERVKYTAEAPRRREEKISGKQEFRNWNRRNPQH
jgi:hypothetical protein